MRNKINKEKLESGLTLPTTILFSLIGTGMLFSFILTIYEKDFQLEFEIAQTKALYNAESGIALGAYTTLFKKDYIPNPVSDTSSFVQVDKNMGYYSIGLFEGIDPQLYKPMRGANATGYAYVKHLFDSNEILGQILATIHNIAFYSNLAERARSAIKENNFLNFKKDFLSQYKKD